MNLPLKQPLAHKPGQSMPFFLSLAVFSISGLFSNLTLDPVTLPRFLVWSILVFGLVFMITMRINIYQTSFDFGILHRVIFPAFICYLAISGLSLIKAINLTDGLFEWLKLFLFTASFYLAVLIISIDRNGTTILVRGIILLATVLSALGICQYYGLAFTSIPGNYVIYATLAHKNLYASALFLMLPFVLFGVFRFSRLWQFAGWIAIISISFSIVLARARTVWVAIIVATLAVGFLAIARHRKSIPLGWKKWLRYNRSKSVASFLFIFILIITLVHFKNEIVESPLSIRENQVNITQLTPFTEPLWSPSTLEERLLLWKISLTMAEANPLLGVGLGQWRLVFPAYSKIQKFRQSGNGQVEIFFQRPHNDYVWVLAETGITGLLFYLAILGIAIFYALKIFLISTDTDSRAMAIFMLYGTIGYLVVCFFSFPKERIVHNIFLVLMLASITSTYHRSFPRPNEFSFYKILTYNIISLLLLAICIFVGISRLNSEIHVKRALAARQTKDWQTLRSEIDKADSQFYRLDPSAVPLSWYRGIANHSMGQVGEAVNDFKKAYQIHPNHIHVLNNLGTGYAQTGDFEKAVEYYKKALEIWPGFTEARINLGVIYYHTGNFEEARRCFTPLQRNHEDVRISVYLKFIRNRFRESI